MLAPLQQLLRTGMTPDSIAATAARVAAEHPALRGRDGDDGGDQAEVLRALAAQLAAVPPPPPPPAAAAAAAEPVAEGGPVHRSGRRRRPPIARTGWDTLAQLPRAFRDGAPGWVRRELVARLARLIEEEGLTAAAIVATAERLAPERIITRDHLAALDAVRTRLRVDLAAGDVCGTCGGQRWTSHGRCPRCDDHRPLDAAEQAQLAAAWTHLTGRPAAHPAASPESDTADWKPP